MKVKYSRRGAFKRELQSWGEIVTLDHVYSGSQRAIGINGEPESLVVRDIYTGMIHVYPVDDKHVSNVVRSLQHFA
jgi:hypothetical protein